VVTLNGFNKRAEGIVKQLRRERQSLTEDACTGDNQVGAADMMLPKKEGVKKCPTHPLFMITGSRWETVRGEHDLAL